MRHLLRLITSSAAAIGIVCGAAAAEADTPYTFTAIAYPGATDTVPTGINDAGQIVGVYTLASGAPRHGFLLSGSTYTSIDYPGALETIPWGISASGTMVGFVQSCQGAYGCAQGFILSGGAFTLLPDAPGSLPGGTFPMAINVSGQVAGWFVDPCICEAHAFVFSGGSYTRVDRPGYVNTSSRGINDLGQLPGSSFQCFGCSLGDGFILSQGVFTAFDVPVANSGTEVTGINNAGDFAGYYFVEPNYHAFVVNAGTLTLIEHPDATQGTAIWGQAINTARQLVGSYVAADGLQHGFLASVSVIYSATVQQPINPDGSSVFNAKRGVVPVKFTLAVNGTPTCQLPPATLSLTRTAGGALGVVNESDFTQPSDSGSNFRVDTGGCQYVYNLGSSSLGSGTYLVQINVGGGTVGSATFSLK